jgi:NADH-quinone oxidoreductase subunit D
MLAEFTRLNSHLVWLGTHAIDIGAMSVFLYCFREREDILRIFEMFSGQRMMTSYFRIGGLALPHPRGWQKRVKDFVDIFPSRVDEYEELLTGNRIWTGRTKGVGYISLEDMLDLGVTGPMLRAAGLKLDVRKDAPYSSYEKFDFKCPPAPRTTCSRAIRCASKKCASRRRSSNRRSKACPRDRIRPMRRASCCRIAKR